MAFSDVCYIKQRVTGKQHIQAYFPPQSVKDVSCSILCTVVMANRDSNIWSDAVPGMARYVHWVRALCKNLLISLLFWRSWTNLQQDSSRKRHQTNSVADGIFLTNRKHRWTMCNNGILEAKNRVENKPKYKPKKTNIFFVWKQHSLYHSNGSILASVLLLVKMLWTTKKLQ